MAGGGLVRSRFRATAADHALQPRGLGFIELVTSRCSTVISSISLLSSAAPLGSGGAEPALRCLKTP